MSAATNATRYRDTWRHVDPRSQHGPPPLPLTGEAWRAQVERDALACGHTAEFAAWLASEVSKSPKTDDQINAMSPRMRTVLGLRMSKPAGRALDDIATLYGATALVPDLRASRMPLREVVALLRDACGGNALTSAGADHVRASLLSRNHWNNQ